MRMHHVERLTRSGIGSTMLAISILTACGDAAGPPSSPDVVARSTVADANTPRRRITAAEFHARNRMDWAGVSHNKGMDRLRAEIRMLKPKDICKTIERLAESVELDASVMNRTSGAKRNEIRKAVLAEVGCRRPKTGSGNASYDAALSDAGWRLVNARGNEGGTRLSPEARLLVNRVMQANTTLRDPDDLATELSAITDEARTLGDEEASLVEAAASVSLSSLEYWTANASAMAREMADAYGPCLKRGGRSSCVTAAAILDAAPSSPVAFRLAMNRQEVCEIHLKVIWDGDVWGAGVGLTLGAGAGGVVGGIVGLVAGAFFGSGAAATYELVEYVICAYAT
jgi:hypothetical protein